jgi:RNA polymerase sigma factor (TIGR02999 family)
MPSKQDSLDTLEPPERKSQLPIEELVGQVYHELRRLADSYLQRERPDHTLQPTALVHEAYLRLADQESVRWQNREHFIGVAAQMMRRILVDYARGHKREKRGGGEYKLSLGEADRLPRHVNLNLVTLDEALEKLSRDYPQECMVVELRFFGGLSIEETAKVLGVSDSTVERDWKFARALLQREIGSR